MNTITAGIFTSHVFAEKALNELRARGVAESDLSYIYVDIKGGMHDGVSKVGSKAAEGGATGAVIGALAGIIVANGVLPGLGTLFVAGPLAAALGLTGAAATTAAGVATGLAAGALIGGFVGLGISDTDAALYQSLVEKGNVLVIARTHGLVTKDIFVREGATEIREYVTK